MPSVSIIVPLHNRAGELPQTIESVLAQTSKDWELIIVDDHSTDRADKVAHEFRRMDVRIKVIPLPDPKRGAPAARNFGLEHATGEFVVFLDSDDLLAPAALSKRVAFLREKPDLDFCVSRCQLFRDTPGDIPMLWNADTGEDDLDRLLTMDVPWQTTGPTWRRKSLTLLSILSDSLSFGERAGVRADGTASNSGTSTRPHPNPLPEGEGTREIWDESVPSGQDWEFHIRAVARGLKYERLNETDCYWRIATVDRDSIGKTSFGKEHARARPIVIRKMHDYLASAGPLDAKRRMQFAALYFGAADTISSRVSRKEGRAVWADAFKLGMIDRTRYKQGDRYFFLKRWDGLAEKKRQQIEREWPRELLPQRGKFFNLAPLSPDQTPTISVVMSAHNNADFLREAIGSILNQTFRDFELIVIDDGSTDATADIARRFAHNDCRVKVISRENKGLTVSLNEGLALARGEFIARMDGDDIAHPLRFEKEIQYLRKNPECIMVGTKVMLTDPLGIELAAGQFFESHPEIEAALLRGQGNALVHPSVMIRKSALDQVGPYKPEYNGAEDLELFLRLVEVGRLRNLPDILLYWRRHPMSVNHRKYEHQWQLVDQIVTEARARRGLPAPKPGELGKWKPEPIAQQFRNWGWNALRQRKLAAVRSHAWNALKRQWLSVEGWKLVYCAMRGR